MIVDILSNRSVSGIHGRNGAFMGAEGHSWLKWGIHVVGLKGGISLREKTWVGRFDLGECFLDLYAI